MTWARIRGFTLMRTVSAAACGKDTTNLSPGDEDGIKYNPSIMAATVTID
jgi:hypothetical protein